MVSKTATEHDESVFVRLLDEGKTVDDRSDEGTADKEANEDRDASVACCLSIVLQWHVPLAPDCQARIAIMEHSQAIATLWEVSDVFWIVYFLGLTIQLLYEFFFTPVERITEAVHTHLNLLMAASCVWDAVIIGFFGLHQLQIV